MNETIKTLLSRRSIRSFSSQQIKDDELALILKAGLYSMSGMNEQSSHFVVLQEKAKIDTLVSLCESELACKDNPYYGAPTIIIVFAKESACTPVQDACLSIGNMANAAASLGIGSCWINRPKDLYATEKGHAFFASLFDTTGYIAVGSLSIGYATEAPEAKPRLENRVTLYK